MTKDIVFEELAFCQTRLGELSLRRRTEVLLGVEVHEVKLGEEFLMSSLFTEGEIALSKLGLAGCGPGPLDVVVGGLGLGYTAAEALKCPDVASLLVVEAMPEVIDWHRRGLVPLGAGLTADRRCMLMAGDFFALARGGGFDPANPQRRFDAILLDIDHSPRHVLNPAHAWLYTEAGVRRLAEHLRPQGVFALWSNDPPDEKFLAALAASFREADARVVAFHNPYQRRDATNTVYVGRAPQG